MLSRGHGDAVEPDAFEALLPGLGEAVAGLGSVTDDREAAGRAPHEQHLPLGVGQLLRLVDDDVGEAPREQVGADARAGRLVDEVLADVRVAQHGHQTLVSSSAAMRSSTTLAICSRSVAAAAS